MVINKLLPLTKVNKVVFLSRGEIHIHSIKSLTVHLKPKDPRLGLLESLMKENNLNIVTVNPNKSPIFLSGFFKNSWYLIPHLTYTGKSIHSGYVHYSFEYVYSSGYNWGPKVVRLLNAKEKDNVKLKQTLI